MGCDIDVLVKDNNIVRIDGTNLTGLKGQLCRKGRFEQVYKETPRITVPLIAEVRHAAARASSWEEALDWATKGIRAYLRRYGVNSVAGFASSLCPNETLDAFAKLMLDTVGTSSLDTLDGSVYRTLTQGICAFTKNSHGLEIESPLESILKADDISGSRVSVHAEEKLLVIDWRQNDLGIRADRWLRPSEGSTEALISALAGMMSKKGKGVKQPRKIVSLVEAARVSGLNEALLVQSADMLSSAKEVVVVYGEGIYNQKDPELVTSLLELARLANPNGLKVISVKPRGNSRGAWGLEIASRNEIAKAKPKLVYILLADDEYGVEDSVLQVAEQAEFLVVQASYASPLTEAADVVFPSPIWAEREGTYLSLDGKAGRSQRVLEPPPGIKDDLEIIAQLTQKLKKRRPRLWPRLR
ncbi:NADPH-Fe(3+) oxidoreductase subunit alpha [subsurface metagenome]